MELVTRMQTVAGYDRNFGLAARPIWHRLAFLVVLCLCGTLDCAGSPQLPSSQDVEAVYLFDFGKFVRWPAAFSEGDIRICVAASPSFAAGMEKTVAGEQIEGRKLEVRRVSHPEEVDGCAILFIDATEKDRQRELLSGLEGKPTLTVSDLPGFLEAGGMIQFQIVQNRVRFSVNLEAINRANLSVSSELLKVALRVQGSAPAGGAH